MATPQASVPVNTPWELRDPDDLALDAANFWDHHGLKSLVPQDVFILGVLAFRNMRETITYITTEPSRNDEPSALETRIRNLEKYQKDSIKRYNGKASLKTLSRAQCTVLATCALAAMTQGWDQSAMSGANIQWPQDLGKPLGNVNETSRISTLWIFGWLNAAPFILGAFVGSLFTDPFINEGAFGRRWAIIIGGLFSFISVIVAPFMNSWQLFMVFRMLLGIGMDAKASAGEYTFASNETVENLTASSIAPIFISEISPKAMRGRLCMSWQLFDTLGIFIGSLANLVIFYLNKSHPDWRFMIALSSFPASLFLTLAIFCVESPRWLMKHNRMAEALSALIELHHLPSRIVACGELYWIFCRLKEEELMFNTEAEAKRIDWKERFRKRIGKKSMMRLRSLTGESQSNDVVPQRAHSPYHLKEGSEISLPTLRPQSRAGTNQLDDRIDEIEDITQSIAYTTDSLQQKTSADQNQSTPDPEQHKIRSTSFGSRLCLLFLVKRMRNAIWASACVMIAQQACGINILAFMSTIMYSKMGETKGGALDEIHNKQRALEFSVVFGAINFGCTFIAIPYIDRKGRRSLLKFSFPAMTICLFIIGGVLNIPDKGTRERTFQAFTFLFTAAFSVGEGPTAFVISSEVFPLIVRELGMSLAVLLNFFWAGILSLLIPVMATWMKKGGFWFFFGGLNIIFWRLSVWLVQETLNAELERIDEKYSKSKWLAFKDMMEGKAWLKWAAWRKRRSGV